MKPLPTHIYVLAELTKAGEWRIIESSFDAGKIAQATRTLQAAQRIGEAMPAMVVSYKFERGREVERS